MSNDLATQITRRVSRLCDGLSASLVWRQLPALPSLGQRLFTRYSDWVDGLLSRLQWRLAPALLFSRSSDFWLSPLSYAWFDRKWIDRRRKSRSFWRQPGSERDEDVKRLPVVESCFADDPDQVAVEQLRSSQSEPAGDIILNLPTLRTLPTGNTGFTRAGHLAKKIAIRLEPLTAKGFHAPWRPSVEATGVPYYPGTAAYDSLLDEVRGTVTGQHLSHLEETFHPSGPIDLSRPDLHPVADHYIETAPMPVAGKFSLAERAQTQAGYPFTPSSERMRLNFEPSGDLPIALSGQPPSEARRGSLPHLFETASLTSNNILVRKVFSRLQSLSGTPLVASSTNLTEEALADSPSSLSEAPQLTSDAISARKKSAASSSYLFEPPQVISDAVLAGKAGAIPLSLPEEPRLFRRDEITDMISPDGRYFGNLVPQPPLDQTLGSRQPSPVHWSAGQISPSLTEEAISHDVGESAKAIASTIKSSSSGGYNRNIGVGLALAPIGRQRGKIPAATSSAASPGQEGASETVGEATPPLDPEALASEVYSILKRRLIVEKERTTSAVA